MMAPHERYRRFLETLTPESLAGLSEQVTDDVRFKDPFNDIRGKAEYERVLRHMFDTLGEVRFTVAHALSDGNTCLMQWRFDTQLRGRPWTVEGAALIRFAEDGRVAEHIDYWDAAENLYERLPIIGWLLARVRGRLAAR